MDGVAEEGGEGGEGGGGKRKKVLMEKKGKTVKKKAAVGNGKGRGVEIVPTLPWPEELKDLEKVFKVSSFSSPSPFVLLPLLLRTTRARRWSECSAMEADQVTQALNTVYTFCSSRKSIVITFDLLKTSVENLIKRYALGSHLISSLVVPIRAQS